MAIQGRGGGKSLIEIPAKRGGSLPNFPLLKVRKIGDRLKRKATQGNNRSGFRGRGVYTSPNFVGGRRVNAPVPNRRKEEVYYAAESGGKVVQ